MATTATRQLAALQTELVAAYALLDRFDAQLGALTQAHYVAANPTNQRAVLRRVQRLRRALRRATKKAEV